MENLIDGAPTLPIGVLLRNEPTDDDIQDLLSDAEEPLPAQ
jgi:DNA helicase-2/ATP-dependent DNA helicase PcrA